MAAKSVTSVTQSAPRPKVFKNLRDNTADQLAEILSVDSGTPVLFQRKILFAAELDFKMGLLLHLHSLPSIAFPQKLSKSRTLLEALEDSDFYRKCVDFFDTWFPTHSDSVIGKHKFRSLITFRNDVAHGGLSVSVLPCPTTKKKKKKKKRKKKLHVFKLDGSAEETEKGLDFLITFAYELGLSNISKKLESTKNSILC